MADDKALTHLGSMDVSVVTPKGEVAHRAVGQITARGSLGEFTLLPGHVPFLTMLAPGVLVLEGGGQRQVFAHGPGYLEVGAHGQVKILVEQAALASAVDVNAAKVELTEVESELKQFDTTDEATWQNLRARRDWAAAGIDAAGRA